MPLVDETVLGDEIAQMLASRRAASQAGEPPWTGTTAAAGTAAPTRTDLRALDDVLVDRRSVRRFAADPPSSADVAFVTERALGQIRQAFPGAAGGLTLLVAAVDVDGLRSGTHIVGPGQCLDTLRPEPIPAALRALAPTAPVLLAICGEVTWACSSAGPGYGGLLVAAGALGYAAWLSALSVGLAASAYGGGTDAVTRIARRHGPGLRHVFTVALGSPLPEPA